MDNNRIPSGSPDLTQENIEKLRELFPEIVTEGKIDFDMLKTVLGEEMDDRNERYRFEWNGKKESFLGAQQPSKGTLRPDKEASKNFDSTENLYIEGDNLEVLKLLQKSYNGKVKMIYIDPPYNTGNDFVYEDDFKDNMQNYLEQTGQVDENGRRLFTNTESSGRFHTNWLNMMYPRLRLSRNLLHRKGLIFVSIDDTELNNLKSIMNETFGEENFVATIKWEKRFTRSNNAKQFANMIEYILVYRKSIDLKVIKEPRDNKADSIYTNPDNDPRGAWTSVSYVNPALKEDRPNLSYELFNPFTKEKVAHPTNAWKYSKDVYLMHVEENRLYWGKNGNNSYPRLKRFLSEMDDGMVPIDFWDRKKTGTTDEASKNLNELMGRKVFDFPKPIDLIKKMLKLILDDDKGNEDIVLDFFAGSSSTAHSVMKLNAEEGSNRKFIMVQLPEEVDEKSESYKMGYQNISEIGQERIRRAGEKILEEHPDAAESLDVGFKVLRLDKSNIREWNVDFENLEEQMSSDENMLVPDRSELDVVYEIMLKYGLELTHRVDSFQVDGKHVYDIAFGNLFICLDDDIDNAVAQAIIDKRSEYGIDTSSVVFADHGFDGNDSEKLNCFKLLQDAGYQHEQLMTI